MSIKAMETWTWVLIYGGLLTLFVGLFALRQSDALGWAMVSGGAVAAAVGVVLIVLRSRLPETESQNMPPRKK